MGYLFALAVVGLLAYSLSAKNPDGSFVLFVLGIVVIGLVWLKNHFNAVNARRRRDESEREQIKSVQDRFKELQVRIITNSEHEPFAFRTLFDANRPFAGKPYSYPQIRDLYFVVHGAITTPRDVETVAAFLSEFYNFYPQSASSKKPICIIEESEEARVEKARLAKELEAQRQRILEIALADIDGRTKEDVGEAGSALYIMVSRLGVKIGISDEPEKRLGQVQTGHPATVSLGKVIWFISRADAALVEKTVHDVLKLQNAHASGEWFNVNLTEASDAVGKIVRDLIQKGEIDRHRVELHSENVRTESDLRLARLISQQWNISRKGNEWLKLGDKNITVFPRQSRWSYVCAGEYAKGTFDTKKEAKIAALQLYVERYGDRIPS